MKIWVVHHFGETNICGIFSSEEKARRVADRALEITGNDKLWIGPLHIDADMTSAKDVEWPGLYEWPPR